MQKQHMIILVLVSLYQADGSKLAIGAPGYDGNKIRTVVGNVRIFQYRLFLEPQFGQTLVLMVRQMLIQWLMDLLTGSRVGYAGSLETSFHVRVFQYHYFWNCNLDSIRSNIDGEAANDILW